MDSEIGDEVVTVVTVEFAVVGDGDGDVDEVFGISVLADIIWHKHTVFNFSQKKKKKKKRKLEESCDISCRGRQDLLTIVNK